MKKKRPRMIEKFKSHPQRAKSIRVVKIERKVANYFNLCSGFQLLFTTVVNLLHYTPTATSWTMTVVFLFHRNL